jgi:hypothetical protein
VFPHRSDNKGRLWLGQDESWHTPYNSRRSAQFESEESTYLLISTKFSRYLHSMNAHIRLLAGLAELFAQSMLCHPNFGTGTIVRLAQSYTLSLVPLKTSTARIETLRTHGVWHVLKTSRSGPMKRYVGFLWFRPPETPVSWAWGYYNSRKGEHSLIASWRKLRWFLLV